MALKELFAGAIVAGAMSLSATDANAVTFSGILESDAEASTNVNRLTLSVDFDWTSVPVTSFVEFTVGSRFDLDLVGYEGGIRDVTGFTLDLLVDNGPDIRLTQQGLFCGAAENPIAGRCNLIGPAGGTNGNSFVSPTSTVFEELDAGSYRLGIFDSGSPVVGSASFEVAAVPLPAGLALLLGGLGVLGFASRRQA